MIETLLAYIIILLPSVITIFGGIATVVISINKMRKSSAETQAVIAEAKASVDEFKASPQLVEMLDKVVSENTSLKKALTLCTEEIKRIHKLHPEWLEDGENNGKV